MIDYVKLETWRRAAAELSRVKAEELALRKEIFGETFASEAEGTHTVDAGSGWTLQAKVPYTRSLDQDLAPDVFKHVKKSHPTLIKVKYELRVAEYHKLDEKTRAGIDAILTTKPGTPSMELVPPKV